VPQSETIIANTLRAINVSTEDGPADKELPKERFS